MSRDGAQVELSRWATPELFALLKAAVGREDGAGAPERAGINYPPMLTQDQLGRYLECRLPSTRGAQFDANGWCMAYEREPAATPLTVTFPVTLALEDDHKMIVSSVDDLARMVVCGDASCTCAVKTGPDSKRCGRCTWEFRGEVVDSDGDKVALPSYVSTPEAVQAIIMSQASLPAHFAFGPWRRPDRAEMEALDVGTAERQAFYKIKPASNETTKKTLGEFEWFVGFTCGFEGCRSRFYVGVTWHQPTKLTLVEVGPGHAHKCAPCDAHDALPCHACFPIVIQHAASTSSSASTACPTSNPIPAILPCVASVHPKAGSVWASNILGRATRALREQRTLEMSPMSLHAWQLRNVAGVDRIIAGSHTAFVGADSEALREQQMRSTLVRGARDRSTNRDCANAFRTVLEVMDAKKSQGVQIRMGHTDDGFTVFLTSRARVRIWADRCEKSADDVDILREAYPAVDGTGNVFTSFNNKDVFLNGMALRAETAARPGFAVQHPLLIWVAITTARNASAFARALDDFDAVCMSILGRRVPPPRAILSDYDRVFLNPMASRWCGVANYTAYLRLAWDVAGKACEAYRCEMRETRVRGPTEAANPGGDSRGARTRRQQAARDVAETQADAALNAETLHVADEETRTRATNAAIRVIRHQLPVALFACVAHTMRDVRDWFARQKDLKLLAPPRRQLLVHVMSAVTRAVENSPAFAGPEHQPHLLRFGRIACDLFALPDIFNVPSTHLDGHLHVRVPALETDPEYFSDGSGRPMSNSGGRKLQVYAVAALTYGGVAVKIPFFERHVRRVASDTRPDETGVERDDSPVGVFHDGDDVGEVADDDAEHAVCGDDTEDNTAEDDKLAKYLEALLVEGPRGNAPEQTETAFRVANRLYFRGEDGSFPMRDVMLRRVARWVVSSPLLKTAYPALTLGGNTSGSVELIWEQVKHRWFAKNELPMPFDTAFESLVSRFLDDEIRAIGDAQGVAPTTGPPPTLVTRDEAERARIERRISELQLQRDHLGRREARMISSSAADGAAAARERGVHADVDTTHLELLPRDGSDAPLAEDPDEPQTMWRRDTCGRPRESDSFANRADRNELVSLASVIVEGRASVGASQTEATASRPYTVIDCLACAAKLASVSDEEKRDSEKARASHRQCPNQLCPDHCAKLAKLYANGELVNWDYRAVVETYAECRVKTHVAKRDISQAEQSPTLLPRKKNERRNGP